jgi:hypothetical protein
MPASKPIEFVRIVPDYILQDAGDLDILSVDGSKIDPVTALARTRVASKLAQYFHASS